MFLFEIIFQILAQCSDKLGLLWGKHTLRAACWIGFNEAPSGLPFLIIWKYLKAFQTEFNRGSWVHFLKAKTLLLFLRVHLTKGCPYFLKTLKNGAVKASQSTWIASVHLHGNRCQLLREDYIPSRTAGNAKWIICFSSRNSLWNVID